MAFEDTRLRMSRYDAMAYLNLYLHEQALGIPRSRKTQGHDQIGFRGVHRPSNGETSRWNGRARYTLWLSLCISFDERGTARVDL